MKKYKQNFQKNILRQSVNKSHLFTLYTIKNQSFNRMYSPFFCVKNIYFILIKSTIIDMTINNPIFIFTVITVIWFIPGIVVRRFNELKQIKKKKKKQADAIKKLYPDSKD